MGNERRGKEWVKEGGEGRERGKEGKKETEREREGRKDNIGSVNRFL